MEILIHIPEIKDLLHRLPGCVDAHDLETYDEFIDPSVDPLLIWLAEADQILCEYLSLRYLVTPNSDIRYYEHAIEGLNEVLERIEKVLTRTVAALRPILRCEKLERVHIASSSGALQLKLFEGE